MTEITPDRPGREAEAIKNTQRVARQGADLGVAPLERIDAAGEAGSVACGALVRIELALDGGRVVGTRYQAYGCPATIACAKEIAGRVDGVSFLEAAAVSEAVIAEALCLRPDQRSSAALALEALHAALGKAAVSMEQLHPPERCGDEGGVLVGMSGGVDSAVAALLLKSEGHRVVGVTLRLWSDPSSRDERSCCSPEAIHRARQTAHGLGIPHLTVDASEAFYQDVVRYFVERYGEGMTPNPCAKCNARVRFGLLLEIAGRLKLSRIGTGHYARMGGSPPGLMRGVDRLKDQSYVLAEVSPELLRRAVFPLGSLTKTEVRARASEAGLAVGTVPESQEICFVTDDDHKRFLREHLGERSGVIVDGEGRPIGRHSGTYNFTIGQRKGLGIASQAPLYVVGLDAERAVVVAGRAEDCEVGEVVVGDVVRHRPGTTLSGSVQLRSSGAAVPAHVTEERSIVEVPRVVPPGTQVSIILEEPAFGVAPGQTAVMYEGDAVILAGTIRSTARRAGGAGALERTGTGPMV